MPRSSSLDDGNFGDADWNGHADSGGWCAVIYAGLAGRRFVGWANPGAALGGVATLALPQAVLFLTLRAAKTANSRIKILHGVARMGETMMSRPTSCCYALSGLVLLDVNLHPRAALRFALGYAVAPFQDFQGENESND